MAAPQLPDSPTERRRDRRRLPQLGMPEGGERRRGGIVASLLLHAAILFLMLVPFVGNTTVLQRLAQGAGGEGPAGGGGGGTRGTGGSPAAERVSFARVAPPPPAPPAVSTAVTPPVVQPPRPVTPPVVVPPRPATPAVADNTKGATGPDVSVVPGTGGGTGSDGTAGSGPGSGGGVGSGVGTGRGSGTGPGTGGGTAENYPPQPMELYLPPEPRPSRVKGTQVIAEFDVDASGKVLSMTFTETPDGGYNRKLRDMLRSITRFRPGTRPDGTPVRMKAQITFDL